MHSIHKFPSTNDAIRQFYRAAISWDRVGGNRVEDVWLRDTSRVLTTQQFSFGNPSHWTWLKIPTQKAMECWPSAGTLSSRIPNQCPSSSEPIYFDHLFSYSFSAEVQLSAQSNPPKMGDRETAPLAFFQARLKLRLGVSHSVDPVGSWKHASCHITTRCNPIVTFLFSITFYRLAIGVLTKLSKSWKPKITNKG